MADAPFFGGGCFAGAGAAGKPSMDAFAERPPASRLPEYVAEELSSMRAQLDIALKEHRAREDRLLAHLLGQPAAGLDCQVVAPPRGAVEAPVCIAVDQVRLQSVDFGDKPPAGQDVGDLLLHTKVGQGDESGVASSGVPQADRNPPAVMGSEMSARNSTKNMASVGSQLFQHRFTLEVVDWLDDLKERQTRRSPDPEDGAQPVLTYHESFQLRTEYCLIQTLEGIERMLNIEEPRRDGYVARFLRNKVFNALVTFAIAVNAIFMTFQVDWQARHHGTEVEPPLAMRCIELVLIILFLLELLLRLSVHRLYYFFNDDMRWNLLDFMLVMLSLYDLVIAYVGEDVGGNVTFFRSVRILRMARVLRLSRILKYAAQLRRMLLSILGSMSSLCWAFAVLLFVFYMFGILAVQSISSKLQDLPLRMSVEEAAALEAEVMNHFGSVSTAMLSFYMATSGGEEWAYYYRLLLQVSGFDALVLILVVVFTQIALFNVLTGIFVENALKVGKPDRDALALERRREDMEEAKALRKFLNNKLGKGPNGTLTFEEFRLLAKNPRVSSVFGSMGLDVRDAGLFFEMINDGNEDMELEVDFIVEACMKMKGPATSLDVQSLLYKMDHMARRVDKLTAEASQTKPLYLPQMKSEALKGGPLGSLDSDVLTL